MNNCAASKEVKKILDSKDNIVDQLKELRKYRYKKEVIEYIDRLIYGNQNDDYDSECKYILYCIVKYFFELDVNEVKEPLPKLPLYSSSNFDIEKIQSLLESKDNIIDQCILLREHKNSKDVLEYIASTKERYIYDLELANVNREFEIYTISKYFYGLDVSEVKPSHIKLNAYLKVKSRIRKEASSKLSKDKN